MKLEILGCHGGELPRHRTTCFLVDGVLALDAGALTGTLDLDALCKVDDVVLSHSHFDHVKDLPLMADLIIGRRKKPVTIHGSRECVEALRKNLFNDKLWPDFTQLPTKKNPVVRLKAFRAGSTFRVGRYEIRSVPVNHPVESCGFVVTDGKAAVAMSGDTGPTERLWTVLNATPNLKAILIETSFPNAQQKIANLSGHLTPRTLKGELRKLKPNGASIFLYHLKPAFVPQVRKELEGLPVEVLELGDRFEF